MTISRQNSVEICGILSIVIVFDKATNGQTCNYIPRKRFLYFVRFVFCFFTKKAVKICELI